MDSRLKEQPSNLEYNLISEFITASQNLTNVPEDFPGRQLETLYIVLKNIFSFLPGRDLQSAACVCRTWSKVARNVLKKRKKLSWAVISLMLPTNGTNEFYEVHSSNFTWDLFSMPIIFISRAQKSKLPDEVTVRNKAGQTKVWKVKDWLRDCLIRSPRYPYPYFTFPCAFFSGVVSSGIATSSANLFACCLPKIPNVEISMHTVSNPATDSNFPKKGSVKALLVFPDSRSDGGKAIKRFSPRNNPNKMALCGGYASQIEIVEKEQFKKANATICISFVETSSKSVFTAYSFFLTARCDYRTLLTKQKEVMKLRENTLVFKCVCTGVPDKAKEHQAFLSVFPDVPYFEFYTDVGEIGWNNAESNDGPPECKKRKIFPEFEHQFTCCYMFLTWNDLD